MLEPTNVVGPALSLSLIPSILQYIKSLGSTEEVAKSYYCTLRSASEFGSDPVMLRMQLLPARLIKPRAIPSRPASSALLSSSSPAAGATTTLEDVAANRKGHPFLSLRLLFPLLDLAFFRDPAV